MAKNHTRKRTKVMTIPQLRKAFEAVDGKTKEILAKHPINQDSVSEFQKVWKSIFHKQIDAKTAESYLYIQSKSKKSSTRKKKGKSQKGGVAPIDYMTRPGLDGSQGTIQGVHGTFLPYVSSGLSFYNDINNIAMDSECGKTDITPYISSDMGSNKVGGRMVFPSVPPSLGQDLEDSFMGRPLGSSPSVVDTVYNPKL